MKNTAVILFFCINSFLFSQTPFLHQGAYNGFSYEYGYQSLSKIQIKNAPYDIDWNRWSMLEDGSVYRLYFMPKGKSDKLYQFGFNPSTNSYEYGYQSTPIISIVGLPSYLEVTSFSMLHDGNDYRLYILDKKNSKKLLQCAYDSNFGANGAYRYGFRSMDEISITDAPYDTDWNRWSMLHDGKVYRLYFMPLNRRDVVYQFGFNGYAYEYGYKSSPKIDVIGFPSGLGNDKFNMLHDGSYFRIYQLQKPK
jgi:hypothetical protein